MPRAIAPRVTGLDEITFGEDQHEYQPVTAGVQIHPDAAGIPIARTLWTRWTLTAEERRAIAKGADIFVGQLGHIDSGMTPHQVEVLKPDAPV